jgi:hypothetical protein
MSVSNTKRFFDPEGYAMLDAACEHYGIKVGIVPKIQCECGYEFRGCEQTFLNEKFEVGKICPKCGASHVRQPASDGPNTLGDVLESTKRVV